MQSFCCLGLLSDDDFLKYMSDKRGTHVDVGHSLVVALINDKDKIGLTPVYYFALQMICAERSKYQNWQAFFVAFL